MAVFIADFQDENCFQRTLCATLKISIMSITILNEIDKAETLVNGLRMNLNEVKLLNVTAAGVDRLEAACKELKRKNEEVDALRRQLTLKVRENNELLAQLKDQMLEFRMTVKGHYEQSQWIRFGVQDKR
jgi:hypothetical protein